MEDINNKSVKELKQYCRDNKIKGFSKLNKQKLIDLINENDVEEDKDGKKEGAKEECEIEVKKEDINEFLDDLTQKQLSQYVRKILDKIGLCNSIINSYPELWEVFMYLFKRHSNYPEKFNRLTDIKIRYNPVHKTQLETIIVKNNGDEDDVSIMNRCITRKPKDNLTIAMRNSIKPQTEEFKIKEFKNNSIMKCVLCHDTKEIETDHYKPQFKDLKTNFLNIWKNLLPNIFESGKNNSKIFKKKDNEFEKNWIEFHRENAILRLLCKKCNSSRKKSKQFK